MKKILLTVAVALCTANLFAQSNCTPDVSCVPQGEDNGVCPDTATANNGPLIGTVNVPMSATFSVMIPATTTFSGVSVNLTQFAVTDVVVNVNGTDVPLTTLGLDYLGGGTNSPSSGSGISNYTMTKYCYFPAPSNACVVLSGTPNQVGVFPATIKTKGRATTFFGSTWGDGPTGNYRLTIKDSPNGLVANFSQGVFSVNANVPNPFDTKTAINFYNPVVSKVKLNVYNVLGKQVFSDEINANAGDNTYTFNAENLTSGVYVYTLNNGSSTISKRMVVDKK